MFNGGLFDIMHPGNFRWIPTVIDDVSKAPPFTYMVSLSIYYISGVNHKQPAHSTLQIVVREIHEFEVQK